MKLVCLLSVLLCFSLTIESNTLSLVCHEWKQIGYKNFNESYKSLNSSLSETLEIRKDGTYEKHLYGNMLSGGNWKMNNDSTKLAFAQSSMNGVALPDYSFDDVKFTDSIIKLTTDTFIYRSLGYYGQQKLYGHNDTYYIRIK
jgi:hypothetical protein